MSKARQLADLGNQVDDGAITGTNMVVNGGMTISQRGTSFTGLTNTSFTLDRFQWQTSTGPTVTIEQSTDAPVGFYNSLKVTVTTTDTMAAGDYDAIYQPIEGLNFSHLGFGASGAKQFTLSFWAKASVTGTYSVNFINSNNSRSWTSSYSIASANTWEYKTIVVDGDISGAWLATNGIGLKVWFSLGSGSTYQAASTSSAWSSGLDLGLTGAVDLRTTSGATFQITGVCLNVGDSAIDFPHESYGDELRRCERYFYAPVKKGTAGSGFDQIVLGVGGFLTASQLEFVMTHPTEMRATPTFRQSGANDFAYEHDGSQGTLASGFSGGYGKGTRSNLVYVSGLSETQGETARIVAITSTAYLYWDAEL